MTQGGKRILFVHNAATSFLQIDLELLKQHYAVTEWFAERRRINLLGLWKAVRSHDLVFGWFASWHTKSIAAPNVEFTGRVGDQALLDYYRRASVYVQVSKHEGFGLSLAEAMLAGCIPVVTNQGAIPEVVGDCGVYAASQDAEIVAESIKAALGLGDEVRLRAQDRIALEFSPEQRSTALKSMIDSFLQEPGK